MADHPDEPIGIFADVLPELRKTLAGCAAFASYEALAAIFVDPRLRPWQQRLPQVQSVEQRVNQVIDLLYQAENEQGENALVLLLHVLKEHEPTRRAALTRLRHALQRGLSDDAMQAPLAGATPYLGLSTFQPEDARFFFGRDGLTRQLVEKVSCQARNSGGGAGLLCLEGGGPAMIPHKTSFSPIGSLSAPLSTQARGIARCQRQASRSASPRPCWPLGLTRPTLSAM